MATSEELAEAFCQVLATIRPAPPLTLMNHTAEEAAVVIAAVVDRCHSDGLGLRVVAIGPELAEELGLGDGSRLKHGEQPQVRVEPDLLRQVRFEVG